MGKRNKINDKTPKYQPPKSCSSCDSLAGYKGKLPTIDLEQAVLEQLKKATRKNQLVFDKKDTYGEIYQCTKCIKKWHFVPLDNSFSGFFSEYKPRR